MVSVFGSVEMVRLCVALEFNRINEMFDGVGFLKLISVKVSKQLRSLNENLLEKIRLWGMYLKK